jgi:hypothetical protein
MSDSELSIAQRDVIRYAKQVATVLAAGTAVAAAAVGVRLFGSGEIKAAGIKVPVDKVWIVLLAVTVAHLFLGWFFVRSMHELWRELHRSPGGGGVDGGRRVFDEVKIESNLFMRGLIPRTKPARGEYYVMRWDDPSTWVAHAAILLTIIAVLPWQLKSGSLEVHAPSGWLVALVVALGVLNWTRGATWAVALSQLTVPPDEAHLFQKKSRRHYFMMSGADFDPFYD